MFYHLWLIIKKIKAQLPGYVWETIPKLIPISFLLSFLDLFGLALILPVIQITVNPNTINNSFIISDLFKAFGKPGILEFVIILLILVVLFFLLKNIVFYFGAKWQQRAIYHIATKLILRQFGVFLNKPVQFQYKSESGDLLRKTIEIPYNFSNGILSPLVVIINEGLVALLILIVITIYNPILFISVLIFIGPLLLIYTYNQKKSLSKISEDRDKYHSQMFAKGKQAIEGFRELIMFDKVKQFTDRFYGNVNAFSQAYSKLNFYNAYSPRIIETFSVLSILLVFIVSYFQEYNIKAVSVFLVAFALVAYRIIPSINRILLSFNTIKSSEFVFNHFEHNDEDFSSQLAEESNSNPLTFNSQILFKNISFKYEEKEILKDISFIIPKGNIVGIIGKSGSGKTTILNILTLLLDFEEGEILLDGKPILADDRSRWYKTISYVPQNVILSAGTIRDNITFGLENNEVDQIRLSFSIQHSQLEEFIDSQPDGLDTYLGDQALNISGGQRQRIGIARALYHGGKVLIFDEPTGSLDKQIEEQFIDSIKELSKLSYTSIIISHNRNALIHCNQIYKLESGEIEKISFNELS